MRVPLKTAAAMQRAVTTFDVTIRAMIKAKRFHVPKIRYPATRNPKLPKSCRVNTPVLIDIRRPGVARFVIRNWAGVFTSWSRCV
jgi:hypothetical protein